MDVRLLTLSVLVVCIATISVGATNETDGCVNIDAVLNWGKNLYFFFGDQYVKVNKDGREVDREDLDEWHEDLPRDLDAAITWTPVTDYFFKGPATYKYWAGADLEGPWNAADEWNYFFEDGIDAAAHREDTDEDEYGAFFFKDCKYIVYWGWYDGYSVPKRVPSGLPCGIDAAWELQDDDDILVALKGDKIWFWGEDVDGPHLFSDYYTFKTVELCPFDP